MVQLLDFIVRKWATSMARTFIFYCRTLSMLVLLEISPSVIFRRMVKEAKAFLM